MARNFSRAERVSGLVHRTLAQLLQQEFKDPRIGMVTISSVKMSPDLKQAKVYITVLEEAKITETLKILNEASGFFRKSLAGVIQMRIVPSISFIFDGSVIHGNRINSILESCIRET